jgi:hypothetical protein
MQILSVLYSHFCWRIKYSVYIMTIRKSYGLFTGLHPGDSLSQRLHPGFPWHINLIGCAIYTQRRININTYQSPLPQESRI